MNQELKAILEYDAARLEIIRLGSEIGKSTEGKCDSGFYTKKCTRVGEKACFELLWDWNRKNAIYSYWEKNHHWEDPEPEPPESEYPPVLCEFCQITQSLVDSRKIAKKRFGIAKVRLSRIARDYRNSAAFEVPEL